MARMLRQMLKKMGNLAALPAAILGFASAAQAQHGCRDCGSGHCPSHKHVQESGPRVRVQRGCPNAVCDPCSLPHWGYYATCWSRWPHAEDQAHCRPVAGMVIESEMAPALAPAPVAQPVPAPQALPQLPPRNPPPGARPLRPGL